MMSESEIEVTTVSYVIHIEFSKETIRYETVSEKFIETACKEIFQAFTQKHIPLTSPPHELFYNPDLPKNVEIKQKRAAESIGAKRGSNHILSPRAGAGFAQVASQNIPKPTDSPSSWRSLASALRNSTAVEIKEELPEQEELMDLEHLNGIDRRAARSTSFNLGTMMDQLTVTTLVRLQPSKRFLSYNLPSGSHLLFKTIEEKKDEEKPIFTGEKQFIRVHDKTGSYKTLFQPMDTHAKYLYQELAEKFNLTYTQDYRIFLQKYGIETMLGDDSTPIQLLSEMEEGELEHVKFIFKDAGHKKAQSASVGPRKPSTACILPIIECTEEKGELDLSFYRVGEFPKEFFELDVRNFTCNQAEIDTLPSLSHFTSLTELRVVNNNFKELPASIFDIVSLTEIDFGNNLLTDIPNEISKLVNLEEIYLYVNQLQKVPEGLSTMKSLRVLNLSNNFISEIPGPLIENFTNLQQLKFSKNSISSVPEQIMKIDSLVDLNLSQNQITELPQTFSNLINLRWLNVKCNKLEMLPQLASLDGLEEVLASHNKISVFNQALRSVCTLFLDHNEIEELGDTVQLDRVTIFNISNNRLHTISDTCMASMRQLTKLSLAFNGLNALPQSIGKLNYLTQLDCKHNHIHKLPDVGKMVLKVLDCGNNQITSLPANLWSISSLWFLQTANNPISVLPFSSNSVTISDTFMGISQISSDQLTLFTIMKNLRTLDLGYANLKSLPSALSKLSGLTVIVLCGNRLKSLPKDIGKLPKLRELYLSCNLLTSLPSSMKHLKFLNVIDVSCNRLKSVSELANIPALQWIDLSYNAELKNLPNFDSLLHHLKSFHVFGCPLKKPVAEEYLHLSHLNMTPSARFFASIADMRGRRDSMEDSMVIRGSFAGKSDWDFYCVLDGHGGQRVAEFGGMELASRIEQLLVQTKCSNPKQTLQRAFKKVQSAIKSAHIGIMEGSTVVLALFIGNELYVANLGDSRAVLSRDRRAIRVSYDHKPESPEEEDRICRAGGFVSDGRINSILAVSRVLGDIALEKWTSIEPYIYRTILEAGDQFLILACDGVWDVMDDQFAVDIVNNADPIQSASLLRDHAYMMGSMDNISCCVIHLQKPK